MTHDELNQLTRSTDFIVTYNVSCGKSTIEDIGVAMVASGFAEKSHTTRYFFRVNWTIQNYFNFSYLI